MVTGTLNWDLALVLIESVLVHIPSKEGHKRGDWMKQWMKLQKLCAVNAMYKKTPKKQATHRTSNGAMKQLDYILIDKKHISCSRDAEANDMIHIGSDHRSVMARFVFKASNKLHPRKTEIEGRKKRMSENTAFQDNGKEDPDEKKT